MDTALRALIRSPADAWRSLVEQGLASDLPPIRELAVDAAAAACGEGDRELLLGLLRDEDPHVAVARCELAAGSGCRIAETRAGGHGAHGGFRGPRAHPPLE